MPKNISNISISNNPPAYRTSHSHGNRNVGNVNNQLSERSKNNVKNRNNPVLINISDEGRQAALDSQTTDTQNKSIDKDALKMMDMQNELAKLANMKSDNESFIKQMKAAQEAGKAKLEEARIRMKCLLIAGHIMSGDEVHKADIKYLKKHDPELYRKAISLRMEKENPKKIKRLSEDEKPEGPKGATDSAGDEGLQFGGGDSMGASAVSVETGGGGESATSSETTE